MVNQFVKEFTGKGKDINGSTVILKVHQLLLDDYSDRKELYRNKAVQAAVLNGKKDEQVQFLIRLNVSPLLFDLGTTKQLPEGKKVRIKDYNLYMLQKACLEQAIECYTASTRMSLSISRAAAIILLCHYNWSVSKSCDKWFDDEENVRKSLGLLEVPVPLPTVNEVRCLICFKYYPRDEMSAPACGHPFCSKCCIAHIRTAFRSGLGCLKLRCPNQLCGVAVGEDMINALTSPEDKENYGRYLCRSFIEDMRKRNQGAMQLLVLYLLLKPHGLKNVIFNNMKDNYFSGEKKAGKKQYKRAQPIPSSINLRPLSHSTFNRKTCEQPDSSTNFCQHLGTAVNQLSPPNLQAPSIAVKVNSGNNDSLLSVQLKKKFGVQLGSSRFTSGWAWKNPKTDSVVSTTDSSLHQKRGPAFLKENSIISKLAQILPSQKVQFRSSSEAGALKTSSLDNMNSLKAAVYQRPMHMEEAETLVKQWQTIKAEALGPNHQVNNLFELLDEAMLVQWQALTDEAQKRSCFWRFVLLQMSILRADILLDDIGNEMAEIEALLEGKEGFEETLCIYYCQ
ncbi:hypothetical protein POM88_019003 [Heracleum sosnowskyi]|uniref:RBR-type E3 ubiquitin transferase n=1 Tax=Heracleum sosnowskyi TaxID=360622 RepID=A0AAD8MV81_9APIA|nr:hypothetical protein POM88_019003 [Heracleum sosnowskyi]